VSMGTGLYYKDFESNILGMKSAEIKSFDIQFPDDYHNDKFRNKKLHFTVAVKAVKDVAEYTDPELAKVLSYDDEQVMYLSLMNDIKQKNQDEERIYYENQILGCLLDSHQFKIPNKLVETEIKNIRNEKPDMLIEQVEEVAARFVKTDLILRGIYERHPDIHFQQEEFNNKIAELALKANESVEATLQKLQSANKLQSYINYLANCKVVDFLISMSLIIEKKEV